MKIAIDLGQGNLEQGCPHVTVQLLRDRVYIRQFSGSLPAAPKLAQLHSLWRQGYRAFYQEKSLRIGLLQAEGMRYSANNFQKVCQQLPQQLNLWLSSIGFAPIEQALRTELQKDESIQIVITAADPNLQRLPWQFWQFLEDYPLAEVSFSVLDWQEVEPIRNQSSQVRILVVLGNSVGLDLQQDLAILQALPDSQLTILTEPALAQLNEYLWQSEGWDILLFSGHSHSDARSGSGYIHLNQTESITIGQLKHSLQMAIARGLQIAIFNSCEGLGLALELADLSLPFTVVMGEPVPDKIAQVFLKYLITAFAGGKTFTLAVKEARQKLAGWETEYVCASWLPAIWRNPATGCLTWNDLKPKLKRSSIPTLSHKFALVGSLAAANLILLVRSLAWLEPLELSAYDRLMRQRPNERIDPRVLVVEITEEDTNRDRYPLSDTVLVEAIDLLEQHQPAAIGIDLHRSYDRDPGYQALIQRLEQNQHLFPVCAYGSTNDSYGPPQGLSTDKIRQQMGFSDLLVDWHNRSSSNLSADRVEYARNPQVRRQLLSYDPAFAATSLKCLTPYSLSFQLSFEYLQQQGVEPLTVNPEQQWQFGEVVLQQMGKRFAGYQQLEGESSQIPINYRAGKPGKKISLSQLRSGNVESEWIENRIILLGYTATVAQDYFDTPYGIMPGVWIHAHMTSQLISAVEDGRSLIWALPSWGDWLWVLAWSLTTGAILARLSDKPLILSILLAVGAIAVADRILLLLLVRGLWLPYVPTVLSILLITCGVSLARLQPLFNYFSLEA